MSPASIETKGLRTLDADTERESETMKRVTALGYGTVCYLIFFGTFLYAIGFLANFGVPKTIDSGETSSLWVAIAVNLALLSVFALQHTIMARIGFKKWWTRFVPEPVERSTYVLLSSAAMILLFWGWQPMTGVVFQITGETGRAVAYALFGIGVATVLYATCLIDHFDLFGLRQVVLYFRGRDYSQKHFVTPALYKHIRHPLYVGWFITFWSTPDMTVGHFLMAAVTTAYILVAIVFEERDLGQLLGEDYQQYRESTPMFIPRASRQPKPVKQGA
jgi:protein-S-isoprenylcysteine O-methyltransferase Ste14